MSTESKEEEWSKVNPNIRNNIEDFLWGLFSRAKTPFFDKSKLPIGQLDAFLNDHEILLLTRDYIKKLDEVWKERNPGKDSLFSKIGAGRAQAKHKASKESASRSIPPTPHLATLDNKKALKMLEPPLPPKTLEPTITTKTQKNDADSPQNASSDKLGPTVASNETGAENTAKPAVPEVMEFKQDQVPAVAKNMSVIPKNSKATFHLPNCKVGVAYYAKIEGTEVSGRPLVIVDLRFPDGFGLTFDRTTQMITGQPLLDGDFELDLQWTFVDEPSKTSGICRLTSNPDPKTLWKVIEPDNSLPYQKSHLDQKVLTGQTNSIAAASRRGRSHEHGGSFRDDDFFISEIQDSGWSVLIVADGAGSAKFSREGSRIAVENAGKQLADELVGDFGTKVSSYLLSWDSDTNSQTAIGTEFHYLFHRIAGNAIQAIEQEALLKNASVKEYSTTLLAAAVKREGPNTFLATFWMGDGAIAAYGPRGVVKLMGTPDGGEYAGQTRFLDRNALGDIGFGKRVRVGRLKNVSAVILMTDGVSDPYFETDNGLADPAKWDVLWDEIQPLLGNTNTGERLVEWLHFFKQGHHDDRTIALLW